jgi:hypothetical protein
VSAEPLNLGQDRLVTINHLADTVAEIAGLDIVKKHVPGPQGVRGRNIDTTRLRQAPEWQPRVALEDGLARTYPWIEAQVQAQLERASGARESHERQSPPKVSSGGGQQRKMRLHSLYRGDCCLSCPPNCACGGYSYDQDYDH